MKLCLVLSMAATTLAWGGLDLVTTAPDNCTMHASYTSVYNCYARICGKEVYISNDYNFYTAESIFVDIAEDFSFLPVNNCTFHVDGKTFTYMRF